MEQLRELTTIAEAERDVSGYRTYIYMSYMIANDKCMYICEVNIVCMYAYIHTYIHTLLVTYIHTFSLTYIHTYIHTTVGAKVKSKEVEYANASAAIKSDNNKTNLFFMYEQEITKLNRQIQYANKVRTHTPHTYIHSTHTYCTYTLYIYTYILNIHVVIYFKLNRALFMLIHTYIHSCLYGSK